MSERSSRRSRNLGVEITPDLIVKAITATSDWQMEGDFSLLTQQSHRQRLHLRLPSRLRRSSPWIQTRPQIATASAEVVVVGAACLDVKGRPLGDIVAGTSNPGVVQISVGGGARNVAENLARLGTPTALLSVVCQDDFGRTIMRQTEQAGVDTDHMLISCEQHSAAYMALQSAERALLVALDDTTATSALTPEYISDHASLLEQARMVVIDANVPLETAETLLSICRAAGVPVALEPVAYAPALRYRPLAGAFYLHDAEWGRGPGADRPTGVRYGAGRAGGETAGRRRCADRDHYAGARWAGVCYTRGERLRALD